MLFLIDAARIRRRLTRHQSANPDRVQVLESLYPLRIAERDRPIRCRLALGPLNRVIVGRALYGDEQSGFAVFGFSRLHGPTTGPDNKAIPPAELHRPDG